MFDADEIAEFVRRIIEFRRLYKGLSTRTEMVVTARGPHGVGHESIEIDELGIRNLSGGYIANKFRVVPSGLRSIKYYDNHRPDTDFIIVLFHGLGLDQDDFKSFLLETDYHCLAPTLYGFHSDDKQSISLPLRAHSRVMARFVSHYLTARPHKRVVLVGFSTGADLLFGLVEEFIKTNVHPHAILLLDTNITRETCFISGKLSAFKDQHESPLRMAHEILDTVSVFQDWVDMSSYLVHVLKKFASKTTILGHFADDVVSAAPRSLDEFAQRVATLRTQTERLRLSFSKTDPHGQLLDDLAALFDIDEAQISLTWHSETSHFGLQDSAFVKQELDALLL